MSPALIFIIFFMIGIGIGEDSEEGLIIFLAIAFFMAFFIAFPLFGLALLVAWLVLGETIIEVLKLPKKAILIVSKGIEYIKKPRSANAKKGNTKA